MLLSAAVLTPLGSFQGETAPVPVAHGPVKRSASDLTAEEAQMDDARRMGTGTGGPGADSTLTTRGSN